MEFWERFCDAPASPELVKGMGRVERICEIVQPFFYFEILATETYYGKSPQFVPVLGTESLFVLRYSLRCTKSTALSVPQTKSASALNPMFQITDGVL
jgi:hypothetical protein